ncbi:MAG TPA: hypothetical protein VHA33_17925 [Candidatus Angelobacter sp.]|nr:hypothetical protein [Candidatus Angelobacter sp.]
MEIKNASGRFCKTLFWGSLLLGLLSTGWASAQSRTPRSNQAVNSSAATDQEIAATREQLYKLLRMSPKLTAVVARDSSLLANNEYVERNNPELAQFLQEHQEVARNPEFYLFANLGDENYALDEGRRELLFERSVWPELSERERQVIREENRRTARGDVGDMMVFVGFALVLGALLWLTRLFLQNRRWGKIFKIQTDTYSKLLEKFSTSTNEELLAYVRSDTGKRFLESASLPVNPEPSPMGGLWSRVMGSLQVGIVLTPVGIGLLSLRNRLGDPVPLLIFGTLALALGIGFIISAGFSFVLGRQMKLLPRGSGESGD